MPAAETERRAVQNGPHQRSTCVCSGVYSRLSLCLPLLKLSPSVAGGDVLKPCCAHTTHTGTQFNYRFVFSPKQVGLWSQTKRFLPAGQRKYVCENISRSNKCKQKGLSITVRRLNPEGPRGEEREGPKGLKNAEKPHWRVLRPAPDTSENGVCLGQRLTWPKTPSCSSAFTTSRTLNGT